MEGGRQANDNYLLWVNLGTIVGGGNYWSGVIKRRQVYSTGGGKASGLAVYIKGVELVKCVIYRKVKLGEKRQSLVLLLRGRTTVTRLGLICFTFSLL